MIPVGILLGGVIPRSTVSITTYGTSTIDAFGRAVDGSTTTTSETIPVHPATSRRMLERLPEADRERETIALYAPPSSALVRASGSRPPTVAYRGHTYEVSHTGDYATQGGIMLVLAQLVDEVTP